MLSSRLKERFSNPFLNIQSELITKPQGGISQCTPSASFKINGNCCIMKGIRHKVIYKLNMQIISKIATMDWGRCDDY